MLKSLKPTEVAEHKKQDSLWIIVDGDVYDLTKVAAQNPQSCEKAVADKCMGYDSSRRSTPAGKRVCVLATHRRWQHNGAES